MAPGTQFPHYRILPGQEELEGHSHREVGTSDAYDLQDASLVQLLCHMSHIKEAWELEARDAAKKSWNQGIRADRVSEGGRAVESRPE